jgi:hypothetical protein
MKAHKSNPGSVHAILVIFRDEQQLLYLCWGMTSWATKGCSNVLPQLILQRGRVEALEAEY